MLDYVEAKEQADAMEEQSAAHRDAARADELRAMAERHMRR